MKSKRIIVATLLFVPLLTIGAIGAKAQDIESTTIPTPPVVTTPEVTVENANTNSINRESSIDKLEKIGKKRINERLSSLDKIRTKINNSTLSIDEKSSLTSMVSDNVNKLTTLEGQIASSTNLADVKRDINSLYSDYRIYGVATPKLNTLISLDKQTSHTNKLNEYFNKVQARIDADKGSGKDIKVRQTALDNAKITLANVENEIADLTAKANSLKPADYPTTSKTVIKALKVGIKDINTKLKGITKSLRTAK